MCRDESRRWPAKMLLRRALPESASGRKSRTQAGSSRFNFEVMRLSRSCASSYCACCKSQPSSAAVPNHCSAENLGLSEGHFRRDAAPLVHQFRKRVAHNAKGVRCVRDGKGSMHSRNTTPPGCGGFFIVMGRSPVVVDIINILRAAVKAENHPPVSPNGHAPKALQIAFERVQPKAR